MFNTRAFLATVDGSTGYIAVAAISGTDETVQNARHVFPADTLLLAAAAAGATMTRARILSPSLRVIAPPHVRPLTAAALFPNDPNIADFRRQGIRLMGKEEHSVEVQNGASESTKVILFVGDGNYNLPAGPEYVILLTGTTTLVASAWTNCPLTMEQALPVGVYSVIGMEAISTTCVAARLVFPGMPSYRRPGCLGAAAIGSRSWSPFSDGGMGEYGRFDTTVLPSAEFLATVADTAQTVFLRCRKVA